jgi:glycosyltransferase involved in cell wall biosynthesis
VLFIGTFVPLQGVEVIARAIVLLQSRPEIRFRIVGDGQSAASVQAILDQAGCTNVEWERGWQTAESLAAEIRAADICLGIFDAGDKAQRVWPLKNYGYMAVGRALISADTPAARALQQQHAGAQSWAGVAPGKPDELAAMIVELAADPARRSAYAEAAAAFFRQHLSGEVSLQALRRSLLVGMRQD